MIDLEQKVRLQIGDMTLTILELSVQIDVLQAAHKAQESLLKALYKKYPEERPKVPDEAANQERKPAVTKSKGKSHAISPHS